MAMLPRLVGAVILVAVTLAGARTLRWVVLRSLPRQHHHPSLRLAVGRLVHAVTVAIGVLVAATIVVPSFTVGSLIQLLGVSGVVVGFAFKDIFQNFLAGILLLVTEPFHIGDQIAVDSFEGTVEEIQTRATLIRTYDRQRVVVPNADLFTKSVTVNTAFPQRRMTYDLTVKAPDGVGALKRRLADVLRSGLEGVAPDPVADVLLFKLGAGVVTLRLRWWSSSEHGEYLVVQDRVLDAVRAALREAGVEVVG